MIFSVWAPKAATVSLVIFDKEPITYPMQPNEDGYFEVSIPNRSLPIDYKYVIDESKNRPDPASRCQPEGVHGPSRRLREHDFEWNDAAWKGVHLKEYIIYELHVGTFTQEATFEAIIDKLPYLKKLGITAIELMPVTEFPGRRNWGYDQTYPYSPHTAYGGPEGLKKLINAAHLAGLAVILDVIYNHLGPEGNYSGDFGYYFTANYKTPWGEAVNYDGPYSDQVRRYIINNALYWLKEFHIDALRLDAIHAIFDMSAEHILKELAASFHQEAKQLGKLAYIIAESDLNDVRIVNPLEKGGYCLDSQWSDDFHHAIHAYFTKSSAGYFADFGAISDIAKALQDGFVYDGKWSHYRKKHFGSPSVDLAGEQFVITIQNHDQIGNACRGVRLHELIGQAQYRLASMLLLFAPNIPLLFMGQEWGASSPFLFFTSFEDHALAKAVHEGYAKEQQVPEQMRASLNPQDPERFMRSKLNWDEPTKEPHASMLAYYQKLINLRKTVACLCNCRKDLTRVAFDEEKKWLRIQRTDAVDPKVALIIANLSPHDQALQLPSGNWTLQCESQEGGLQGSFIKGWTALLYTR